MTPITPRAPNLEMVVRLVSEPEWSNLGMDARMAYAMLTCGQRGRDTSEAVAALLHDDDLEVPFEDTLVGMSQARIALLDIAAMMKVSLREQWKAVDAVLVARGLPATGGDDELCGDDELLALRPAFEAGCAKMRAATAAVAKAEKRPASKGTAAAYAAQNKAIDADSKLAARVATLRARTKEGIQFKQEVRAYWKDCECPDLDKSIFADLVAYVEASP